VFFFYLSNREQIDGVTIEHY